MLYIIIKCQEFSHSNPISQQPCKVAFCGTTPHRPAARVVVDKIVREKQAVGTVNMGVHWSIYTMWVIQVNNAPKGVIRAAPLTYLIKTNLYCL